MNLITQTLTLPDRYTLAEDALAERSDLLEQSRDIDSIANAADMANAGAVGSVLQRHLKEVKDTRLALARPLNEAADKLIAIEREYCQPIIEEKDRLGRMVTAFRRVEEERVAEEQRKRAIEIQKAEEARMKAEAAARKAADKSPDKSMAAELKAYHATEAANALITTPPPAVSRAKGAATKRSMAFMVLDPAKVYTIRPDLCSVEVKPSAVKAVLFAAKDATEINPDLTTMPGLALWWQETTSFRS